jgi:hypothetical protein
MFATEGGGKEFGKRLHSILREQCLSLRKDFEVEAGQPGVRRELRVKKNPSEKRL